VTPLADDRTVVVLCGPTAVGKTAISLALSKLRSIEVISADARQVYRYLDIGTAKPTPEERSVCPHHLIDILDPDEPYSAAHYAADAQAAIQRIPLDTLPVLVGGSGLYINAALDGLSEGVTEPDADVRANLLQRLHSEGIDTLYDELRTSDPLTAARYADRNPRRILRALEHFVSTGTRLSDAWEKTPEPLPYRVIRVGIMMDRPALVERIEQRCAVMWSDGLLDETRRVLDMGYSPSAQSLHTVGYRECIDVIEGRLSEADAYAQFVIATRQYAKRQMTWFRRDPRVHWITGSTEDCVSQIAVLLSSSST
jgi:tRNA dimethylallyltransferase